MDHNEDNFDQDTNEMSFTDKVAAVFTEPANLFESIKNYTPKVIDWLIPTIILVVLTVFSSIMQLNDIEIKHELREKSLAQLQKMVDDGKLPAENFEQAVASMDNASGYQLFGVLIGVPFTVFIILFIMALIYLAISKFILKGSPLYGHVLSMVGLINIIGIFSVVVGLVLSILYGKMNTGLNLALLASPETSDQVLTLLKAIDPFTIWSLILTSIGLAKLSSASFQKSAICVFGFAIVFLIISILLSNVFSTVVG